MWPLSTEAVGKLGVLEWNKTAVFSSHFAAISVGRNKLPPKFRGWRKTDAAFTSFIKCDIIMTQFNVAINFQAQAIRYNLAEVIGIIYLILSVFVTPVAKIYVKIS